MHTFASKGADKSVGRQSAPSHAIRTLLVPASDRTPSLHVGPVPAAPSGIPINSAPPGSLQRQLAIGSAHDESEQQAEAMAAKVPKAPSPVLQRQCSCGGE